MKKFLYLFIGTSLLFVSCNKDDDGLNPTSSNLEVQDFMWKAMNFWYFWQADVPDLADDRFSTNQEYTNFLSATANPEEFYDSLKFNEDRFSFFRTDFQELVDLLNGVSRSNGLEFGLVRYGDGDDVLGYVRYIIPNSDASTRNIKRGDIFTRVDGTQLTGANFSNLLFGENNTYTLGLADIVDNTIVNNDNEVTLTKEEGLEENPILIANTLDVDGQKIGYLMYNGFISGFNEQLNNTFGSFVAEGVTDLVLDFRYNGGGSVNTSRLLASMVKGTNTGDLYVRQQWNSKVQPLIGNENLEDFFASSVFPGGPSINTLNLNRVYVLTTTRTASASELVMNGLEPYIDVIHIGENTSGKPFFSITLVDDPTGVSGPYTFGSGQRVDDINPNNSYAIQPLVGFNENANGFSDYTEGLVPDIVLEEDLTNLGVLGDINEPLLARALQEISGTSTKTDFSVQMPLKILTDSKMFTPLKDNMYLDKPINLEFK